MTNKNIQLLIEQAFNAQQFSHSPYSGFKVGAAVASDNGKVYAGCNVENVAFPLGQCAEATAIGNMVTDGQQAISSIVIASPNEEFCFPCGGCRQKIAEFASDDTPVIMATKSGKTFNTTIGELLPHAFRASDLNQ